MCLSHCGSSQAIPQPVASQLTPAMHAWRFLPLVAASAGAGKPIAPTVQHRQLGQFMIKRSSWLKTSTRAYHAHVPSRQLEPLSLHESINDSKCPVPGFDNFTRPLVSLASFAAPGLVTPGSRQEDAGRGRPRHFMPGLYVIRRCASVCVEVGASATHALQIARISCARICVTILNVA